MNINKLKTNWLTNFFAFASVLYFITFLHPFYVWIFEQKVTYSVFVLFSLIVLIYIFYSREIKLKRNDLYLFILYLFFVFVVHLPFRNYDIPRLNIFIYLISSLYFVFDDEVKSKALVFFYNIVFISALLSIVNLVFYSLGMALFIVEIPMPDSQSYPRGYDLYFGSAVLKNQYFNIYNISIFRGSGWFAEPGHFALFIILALALKKKLLSGFKNLTLILALLLTFSGAGYALFLALLSIKLRDDFFRLSLVIVLVAFLVVAINPDFITYIFERFITSKFDQDNVLQARQTYFGPLLLDLPLKDIFFGLGSEYFSSNNWTNSDFTGFIYRYGLIGLLALISYWAMFIMVSIKEKNKAAYVFVFFVILIFMHRSFMLINPFLMFIGVSILSTIRINKAFPR